MLAADRVEEDVLDIGEGGNEVALGRSGLVQGCRVKAQTAAPLSGSQTG